MSLVGTVNKASPDAHSIVAIASLGQMREVRSKDDGSN